MDWCSTVGCRLGREGNSARTDDSDSYRDHF
jgi:hypothetical protein